MSSYPKQVAVTCFYSWLKRGERYFEIILYGDSDLSFTQTAQPGIQAVSPRNMGGIKMNQRLIPFEVEREQSPVSNILQQETFAFVLSMELRDK